MKHTINTEKTTDTIMAGCPICGTAIPFANVDVTVTGKWRPRIQINVTGDGTDYVAHLWSHRINDWGHNHA